MRCCQQFCTLQLNTRAKKNNWEHNLSWISRACCQHVDWLNHILGLKTFNHCWLRRFGLLTNLVWLCRRADDFVGYHVDVEDKRWCMLFELMEIEIFLESNGHEVGGRWWWLVRWAIGHSPIGVSIKLGVLGWRRYVSYHMQYMLLTWLVELSTSTNVISY